MRSIWVVAVMTALVGVLAVPGWSYDEAANRRLERSLEETVVTFSFEEQTLDQAFEFLGTLGNVNIVLDHNKVDAGRTISMKLKNVPLSTAIKLITEAAGVKYVLRDGVVYVSDEEGTREEPVTQVFDVMDLVMEIPEFEGPDIELSSLSGQTGGAGSTGGGIWGGGGAGTTTTGEQGMTLQERTDALVELIKSVIAPDTWEGGGY